MAMPDSVDMFDNFMRLPNLAIVSLAGNLKNHKVKTVDLILHKPFIRKFVKDIIDSFKPHIVGLSAMTFQFHSLVKIAHLIRELSPDILVAAGGYHASLMAHEITSADPDIPLDFIIRGEGELTFQELVNSIEGNISDFKDIKGISYKKDAMWFHNPDRGLLDLASIALPDRSSRTNSGFYYLNMPVDVVETSRGCVFNCKFCSITQVYGNSFRKYPLSRIIADLKNIKERGTRAVFFADDNITYDISHFRSLCKAIIDERLNDIFYTTQATALGIANNPELVSDMRRANFKSVFVGFESMDPASLHNLKKPTNPDINQKAAELLKKNGIAVIAGIIVGYPNDTAESIQQNFRLLRKLKPDGIVAQFLTPYPKTALREEMLANDLVVNKDDFSSYDGYSCNIRTRNLDCDKLYRLLRYELLKSYFNPSLILNNYFIRNHGIYYFQAIIKSFMLRLYNFIKAHERKRWIDL